ncbi:MULTISPECIES: hypothetical protein [unclassified Mesorhizobium]|uniref:hypothetical protein n=1 Tax=unclassified Mesorhizobium TaxID=325217 RepID=UPI000FCAB278|nr:MULTISPECIES: hypothetical protein [unclassified Mesorhizobium]TIT79091.1 MAG: hypothetical protein E5W57_08460 [Mesorhizobium sp.]TGP26575.1 hypothetical protein EN874_002595 [Mesorhizobium sp. M1D.F.Ca.ET.231.01.1.1]TGP38533.1 hypothetical protein EN877_02595 [Mesorhizobium sp. M1D.F.Ca.ET.234.01.1.1]TGS50743.1 hypothetical protein EN827_02595 [Mesorhizobium sp. M1D.F.Ca.ET.184.01.1.1]TGS66628.1 hypothetical protein EN826_002595 [Mesorhizobium sp. M1D.F.Ca.ET.183.01.1.1]
MTVIFIGMLLTVAGIVYVASAVLWRGQLSNPASAASDRPKPYLATPGPTLEPRRRGLRFLGLSQNWPGLLMMMVGLALLLSVVIL